MSLIFATQFIDNVCFMKAAEPATFLISEVSLITLAPSGPTCWLQGYAEGPLMHVWLLQHDFGRIR